MKRLWFVVPPFALFLAGFIAFLLSQQRLALILILSFGAYILMTILLVMVLGVFLRGKTAQGKLEVVDPAPTGNFIARNAGAVALPDLVGRDVLHVSPHSAPWSASQSKIVSGLYHFLSSPEEMTIARQRLQALMRGGQAIAAAFGFPLYDTLLSIRNGIERSVEARQQTSAG